MYNILFSQTTINIGICIFLTSVLVVFKSQYKSVFDVLKASVTDQ